MTTITAAADPGYLRESHFRRHGAGGGTLVLETAPGMTPEGLVPHPVLFSGPVHRPDVVAVASTRYVDPIPGDFAALDPIVTAQGDRLRCEVFSACNGVHAGLDLL